MLQESFQIKIPRKQAWEIISEYYKKYEGFNGEVKYKLYSKSSPDDWGFIDYYGRIDLVFVEKIKILNQEIQTKKIIKYDDINLREIFTPFMETLDYEVTSRGYFDFDVSNYGSNIRFKSVLLWVKRKNKEKILKK